MILLVDQVFSACRAHLLVRGLSSTVRHLGDASVDAVGPRSTSANRSPTTRKGWRWKCCGPERLESF